VKKPTAFGKYYLLERISVGGMAEVFRAKAFGAEGFERLVAVKRILPNIAEDKDFIRMFVDEAKLAVQLTHANIAQIFDLGVVDGSYYIALEHVHGRDLRGVFERCRHLGEAMPVAQACFLAMKVCEGLDYAHNKRDQAGRELALVHRDVSPPNVLVSFEGEVKLIDFGIAKAAGMGSRTRAGVLKGKFGYMSPEQVSGAQVDRRSDVFSCGIVLYELLTGERLFTGESDYTTLEKVKNVEILPPSTYNRKVPDELERIVLKALAKDTADRYQNAIDLHDELQAFVYTAGEFYSRKDLASWMKQVFRKEIEDETAKLESYRQLKAPPATPAPAAPAVTTSGVSPATRAASANKLPPRVATQPVPTVRSAPATVSPASRARPTPSVPGPRPSAPDVPLPPPMSVGPVGPVTPVTTQRPVVPVTTQLPVTTVMPIPAPTPVTTQRAVAAPPGSGLLGQAGAKPASVPVIGRLDPAAIGWEDDDVETQIYADQDVDPKPKLPRAHLPLQPPVSSSPAITLSPAQPARGGLVRPDAMPVPPAASGWERPAPVEFPKGSNNLEVLGPAPRFDLHDRTEPAPKVAAREISAPSRLVSAAPTAVVPPLDPMASFGARIVGARRSPIDWHKLVTVVIGGAAVAAVGVVVVLLTAGNTEPVAPAPPPQVAAKPIVADPNTGFDLYVIPAGVTQWRLDGEARTDRLPSRIRGISAGPHTVQIDPPTGYLSQLQHVAVEAGKSSRVDIKLQPLNGVVGRFESTPSGATVSLVVDGKRQALGPSPAKSPLDPRSGYQVLFEKPGYVSVNRAIRFAGDIEVRVSVTLDKVSTDPPAAPAAAPPPAAAAPPAAAPASAPQVQRRALRAPDRSPSTKPTGGTAERDVAPAGPTAGSEPKTGTLVLGAKPPCEIAVDGKELGLRTPQTAIALAVGRHQVTLINTELGIRETFPVDIKADSPLKVIKDFSDRMPH